jgi:hypothetical protein
MHVLMPCRLQSSHAPHRGTCKCHMRGWQQSTDTSALSAVVPCVIAVPRGMHLSEVRVGGEWYQAHLVNIRVRQVEWDHVPRRRRLNKRCVDALERATMAQIVHHTAFCVDNSSIISSLGIPFPSPLQRLQHLWILPARRLGEPAHDGSSGSSPRWRGAACHAPQRGEKRLAAQHRGWPEEGSLATSRGFKSRQFVNSHGLEAANEALVHAGCMVHGPISCRSTGERSTATIYSGPCSVE